MHPFVLLKTKKRFEDLLRDALKDSPQMCTKKNMESCTPPNHSPIHNYEGFSEEENKKFLLNKFFEQSSTYSTSQDVKPIPKPRTKLKSDNIKNSSSSLNSSNGTFKVTTDIDQIQSRRSSISSTTTYKVSSPKVLNNQNDDSSSQRTFKVPKKLTPKIGDIIIHEKDSVSKIIDVQVDHQSASSNSKGSGSDNKSNSALSINVANIDNELSEQSKLPMEDAFNEMHLLGNREKTDFLKITIHKMDKLLFSSLVIHPVVKIHIVDINTGHYLMKNNKNIVDSEEDNLDYIGPIMTKPYNLQEKRSLLPMWEETISITEDYNYFVEQKDNIIIFLEILDFVAVHLLNSKPKGWHEIAFAFLKVSGKNNALNFNRNMRLQLYYCSYKKENIRKCYIWETWSKGMLKKYPSSLYISIVSSGIKDELPKTRKMSSTQKNEISKNSDSIYEHDTKTSINTLLKNTSDFAREWKKSAGEITKLPNEFIAQFETDMEGCFTLRFNHSGSLLACSLKQNNMFQVVIFSMDNFEQVCSLPGHQDLIYSIRWSSDDLLLIASSADCSVSVWNVKHVSFQQILPHPSFVYANEIASDVIVTGCYDTKVRIWRKENISSKYLLNQELEGHTGYITSLVFKKNLDTILSSDSFGAVIEWYKKTNTWVLHRKIKILGLEGIIINQLELIAKEKRLLVHSRDNMLRIIDLESSFVIHWLQGGLNTRFQTSCTISPCGNYIFAGSENSVINIWNSRSGKLVDSIIPYKNKSVTVHALHFHPKNNLMAIGTYEEGLPILLFGHTGKKN